MEPDQALEISVRLNTALSAIRAALTVEADPDLEAALDHLERYLRRLLGIAQ